MSKDEILKACEAIFYYEPKMWSEETHTNINELVDDKWITPVSEQHPNFMNSSYAFVLSGTFVDIVTRGCDSWLEISKGGVQCQ